MPELATQGAVINYAAEGEGDPLVLVHGSWDERETWRQVVPLLIDEFRVITSTAAGMAEAVVPGRWTQMSTILRH